MIRTNALAYAHLVRLLFEGGYSRKELAEKCGLHYRTVTTHIAHMHKIKIVYVNEYQEDSRGRNAVPCLKLGFAQPDVKRPKPIPAKIRSQRVRNRKKAMKTIQSMVSSAYINAAENNRNSLGGT